MNEPASDPSESFFSFSRRSMFSLLAIVVVLGGTGLAMTLSPAGAVARSAARASWLIPVAIAVLVAAQASARKGRWAPDSPAVKAVMEDEFRRTNMNRAARAALLVVLIAQWPLGLTLGFLGTLPPPRTAMAMAVSTTTLGMATLIALFLIFDRE